MNQRNDRAMTALVLGICGLLICPVLLSIPAIVVGARAKREIDASGGRQEGRGMAQAGFVLGWIGTTLWGVAFVLGFLVQRLVGPDDEGVILFAPRLLAGLG